MMPTVLAELPFGSRLEVRVESCSARTRLLPIMMVTGLQVRQAFFVLTLLPLSFADSSETWKTLSSLYPFYLVFFGILGLDLRSRQAAPMTLCITTFLGMRLS